MKLKQEEILDPSEYYTFDLIGFLYHTQTLSWLRMGMQQKLHEFKKICQEEDKIKEAQEKIDIMGHTEMWIRRLQDEYNAQKKVSFDNYMANLYLNNKVMDQQKEIEALKKQLEF